MSNLKAVVREARENFCEKLCNRVVSPMSDRCVSIIKFYRAVTNYYEYFFLLCSKFYNCVVSIIFFTVSGLICCDCYDWKDIIVSG